MVGESVSRHLLTFAAEALPPFPSPLSSNVRLHELDLGAAALAQPGTQPVTPGGFEVMMGALLHKLRTVGYSQRWCTGS